LMLFCSKGFHIVQLRCLHEEEDRQWTVTGGGGQVTVDTASSDTGSATPPGFCHTPRVLPQATGCLLQLQCMTQLCFSQASTSALTSQAAAAAAAQLTCSHPEMFGKMPR
jgi:hypothetical protein